MTADAAVPPKSGSITAAEKGKQVERLKVAHDHEFKMPLHYPRYSKSDYEKMPEWQLERLLSDYGLPVIGDVHYKRNFAIGAFLWPTHDQSSHN